MKPASRLIVVSIFLTLFCHDFPATADVVPLPVNGTKQLRLQGSSDRPPYTPEKRATGSTIYGAKPHWRDMPIPLRSDGAPTALDYHHIPFDRGASEAGEPLVELSKFGIAGESYYARTDGLNAPYYRHIPHAFPTLMCRHSVAERLRAVNRALRQFGVELFVLDAWRPIAVQRGLWTHFTAVASAKLHTDDPQAIKQYAGKFCSNPEAYDPSNEHTWPTHITGGAVDLTLRNLHSGELLYMGGIFDDSSNVSFTDCFERRLAESNSRAAEVSDSDLDAVQNRRLLYWAMKEQGFANYSYEWWHFDFGTQMWAINSGRGKAFYKPANWPPAKQ